MTIEELRLEVRSLHHKLDTLVKNGKVTRPTEYLSFIMLIILIVIGVLGGVLAEYLMEVFDIKGGQHPSRIIVIAVIALVIVFILRQLIG